MDWTKMVELKQLFSIKGQIPMVSADVEVFLDLDQALMTSFTVSFGKLKDIPSGINSSSGL
jgi:hypothetical protein